MRWCCREPSHTESAPPYSKTWVPSSPGCSSAPRVPGTRRSEQKICARPWDFSAKRAGAWQGDLGHAPYTAYLLMSSVMEGQASRNDVSQEQGSPQQGSGPAQKVHRASPAGERKHHEVGIPLERLAAAWRDSKQNLPSSDEGAFGVVLGETVEALSAAQIDYALMGGIASTSHGRPRWTHDIDVFVRPGQAEAALDALAERGFQTQRTDPAWLFKAFKQDVLVDVIFRSTGGFYLDDEMVARSVEREVLGHRVRLLAPEDLLVIKAAVHRRTRTAALA